MKSQVKIDRIDVKILKTLLMDARTSFATIARECGVSTNMIANRFNRLKRLNVIVGGLVMLRYGNLGIPFGVAIGIVADPTEANQIMNRLNEMPEILLCLHQIGKFDIYAFAAVPDLKNLEEIRERIRAYPGVKETSSNIFVDFSGMWLRNLSIRPTG